MENVTRALMIAFSMLIFVIAFSYSMFLINSLTATSNTLLESVTTTKYYDNIKVSRDNTTTRDVGIDTIIPTLYRYYKENYAVKILDKNGDLIQLFDVNIEGKIAKAAAYTGTEDNELISLKDSEYNKTNPDGSGAEKAYLFEAPWIGSTDENTRARIDYFLNGSKGYINNTLVDYSKTGPAFLGKENGFIGIYGNTIFEESFVEYAYEGETISTEDGVETITGNTQESSKIIIIYKEK